MSKTVSLVPDLDKVQRKLAALPTIEDLRAEADPHEMDEETFAFARSVARALIDADPRDAAAFQRVVKAQQKQHRKVASKSMILAGYKHLTGGGAAPRRAFIEDHLVSKAPRSHSGVLVVTVFTSAFPDVDGKKQTFSCQWNCYYCPNEPGQPRSYLLNEPGVRRANRLDFDPVRQFDDRVRALQAIGHPADKVELLVLGGTWESYPPAYRERFVRDLFYAANTYYDEGGSDGEGDGATTTTRRPPLALAEEHRRNETARCKIIGLTLETRPDTINPAMLVDLRRLGCTRVQLGVQHTNDGILRLVNREATRADTVRAIRLLKDACFKVDIHLMPDLPGATPELDVAMFDDVLSSPDLQADQWKIYPCMTTPWSVIQTWYEQGKYRSYGLESLMAVILHAKRRVHPWIRLNRVIRDIPVEYVLEGVEVTNLRQLLQIRLRQESPDGRGCQCIRCREIKSAADATALARTAVLRRRDYAGSRGREVFLSFETPDAQHLFAFLRLRIVTQADQRADEASPFPELAGCALVRELHVYGNLVVARPAAAAAAGKASSSSSWLPSWLRFGGASAPLSSTSWEERLEVRPNASGVDEDDETPLSRQHRPQQPSPSSGGGAVQHMGFGTRLLAAAEAVAVEAGVTRAAVISGIGVRGFYRRRGYEVEEGPHAPGGFMIKRDLDVAAGAAAVQPDDGATPLTTTGAAAPIRSRRRHERVARRYPFLTAAAVGTGLIAVAWAGWSSSVGADL